MTTQPKRYTFKEKTRKECIRLPIDQIGAFVPVYPEILKSLNPRQINFGIWISGSDEILEYVSKGLPVEEKTKRINDLLTIVAALQSISKILIRQPDQKKMYDHLAKARSENFAGLQLDDTEKSLSESYLRLNECSTKIMSFIDKKTVQTAEQISIHVISKVSSVEHMTDFLFKIIGYDDKIFDHISFVTLLSLAMGQKIGLSDTHLKLLTLGCLFMDIGITQLDLPNYYTHKLEAKHQRELEKHPSLGVDILNEATAEGVDLPEEVFTIILQHHEKFNGLGYPNQLKGRLSKDNPTGIHILPSIVGLADKFANYFRSLKGKPMFRPIAAIKSVNRLVGDFDPDLLDLLNQMVDFSKTRIEIQVDSNVNWIIENL